MSNPKGWDTETYNKTAYNAGHEDFFRRDTKRNPYKHKTLREMWEKGWNDAWTTQMSLPIDPVEREDYLKRESNFIRKVIEELK